MPFYIGKSSGFSQRHSLFRSQTPFLRFLNEKTNYLRSPVSLPDIRNDVLRFGTNTKPIVEDSTYHQAWKLTAQAFSLPPVPLMHLNDVFKQDDLNIWRSSPGLPWKDLGYATKNDVRKDPDAVNSVRFFWHRIKTGHKIQPPDCCAFVRAHLIERGESRKVRAVWGYPATITFGEAVFALPLIDAYSNTSTPIAYGYETAIGGATRLIKETAGQKYFTALDFKNFDKTVHRKLIERAFDVLELNLNFLEYKGYGVPNIHGVYRQWDYVKDYFINTTIRLCNGERYKKRAGVSSGSYFTQLIDSVVNYFLCVYVWLKQHGRAPAYIKVLGDDSIIADLETVDLDTAQEHLEAFGMILNLQKSGQSRKISNITFLGFQINDGVPTRPYEKWMASLLFPEDFDTNMDEVQTRALGLYYACACSNTRFAVLCRQIVRLAPFDLSIGKGLSRYLTQIGVSELPTTLPTALQFARRLGVT